MMKKVKVAVTGGIGSGKSTVLNLIKELGYPVFSCDEICADLYKKQSVLRKIKKIFPSAVSGKLFLTADKKKITELSFNDDENYNKLSSLLQGLIVKRLYKLMKREKGVCFAEVPLLFEGGYQKDFDRVIVVTRDKKARIDGVKARSNISEETFNIISSRQVDYEKIDLSNCFVMVNDGGEEDLALKIEYFLSTLE